MKKTLLKLMEFFSNKESFKSGKKAPNSGIYRCENTYIVLSKNEKFPPRTELWVTVFTL